MTYCDFKPGDEVVCVDAAWRGSGSLRDACLLVDGATYTIAVLTPCSDGAGVHLREIDSENPLGYHPDRFRKVERKTDKLSLTEWLAQPTDYDEEQRNPAPAAPAKRERVQ